MESYDCSLRSRNNQLRGVRFCSCTRTTPPFGARYHATLEFWFYLFVFCFS